MTKIADYAWLTGPEAVPWLAEFAEFNEPALRLLGRLRKVLSAERSRLVVEQLALRRRAVTKFGSLADRMFFTDLGLQQATDRWIAHHKAARLDPKVQAVDYCCGIGGDMLALAERGSVRGWDRAPEVACLAEANLREVNLAGSVEVCVGNVEDQTPEANEVWHLDPDRRVGGKRSTQVPWHSPGPEVVERWLQIAPNGILKLAPAAMVPEPWQREAELEWISRNRECRQLVVWFGELAAAAGCRRATVLKRTPQKESCWAAHSFQGDPRLVAPRASDLQQYVYEVDPAIRAARLTGALAIDQRLAALAPGAAYLTAECQVGHPLLACFRVVEHLPLRMGPLKNYLRSRGIGCLEIKKRGVKIDPEHFRKQLQLRGHNSATLLLGRAGVREIAILAQRYDPEIPATG